MIPKPLRLIGMARRANRLVWGLETVGKAANTRLLLLAQDAGAAVTREAEHIAQTRGVPLLRTPFDRETLGSAIGQSLCAVAALTDEGLARGIQESIEEDKPPSAGTDTTINGGRPREGPI